MCNLMIRQIRFQLLVLLQLLSISGAAIAQELTDESFRAAMDPYIGVWQGEYRIYSQTDELLNQFKVNRNYWWEGSVLMGRVSYDFGEVKQTFFHRIILSDGMPFSFVTDSVNANDIRSALKGDVVKGTIVWSRVLPKGGLPVRISERIVNSETGRFIEFWGNQEATGATGDAFLVRIEGFASYLPDSRGLVVATQEVEEVGETVTEDSASKQETVKDRDRRMETMGKEQRGSSSSRTASIARSEPSPVVTPAPELKPERALTVPVVAEAASTPTVPEQQVERDPGPSAPIHVPQPSIEAALNNLNIVGINDREGEVCIVVDYFLLYTPGDLLDMDQQCRFVGLDAQFLYFEDRNGVRYSVFRKDAR
jgi:hypothetical protein